jgi:20S proteasome subunit alpha 4
MSSPHPSFLFTQLPRQARCSARRGIRNSFYVCSNPIQLAVVGDNCIALAVEKKSAAKLQDRRTARKIMRLDDHIAVAVAGLTADARVLIQKARVECQSHRLTVEDAPKVEYVTRYIATVQQKHTQSGGVRPFGVSVIVAGFDHDGTPKLYVTEPSGSFTAWSAASIGRSGHAALEFLETHYNNSSRPVSSTERRVGTFDKSEDGVLRLAVAALLEVVESGPKNIELAILKPGPAEDFQRIVGDEELAELCARVTADREAAGAPEVD